MTAAVAPGHLDNTERAKRLIAEAKAKARAQRAGNTKKVINLEFRILRQI